jgi:dipeptidyl aminopeptidase/acylaminoacyl peptidase
MRDSTSTKANAQAVPARERRCVWISTLAIVLVALVTTEARAQDEADTVRPNSLRWQPLGPPGQGRDIIKLPEYDHVGSPSCSRDGEWVAFDAYKTVSPEKVSPPACWVVRRDGMGLRKVADGAAPRWSPDGKRLLFMREGADDRDKSLGIFSIDRDGTGERRIGAGRWPDWSPDGARIAFSLGGRGGGGVRPMARVHTARADGSDARLICDGDCPSWSPDSKRIACSHADPARPAPEVRVVDLESRREVIAGYGWYRADWSRDGKNLVCNGVAGPDEGMVRFWVDGSNRDPLLPGPLRGLSPCYSGNDAIVFVREQTRK